MRIVLSQRVCLALVATLCLLHASSLVATSAPPEPTQKSVQRSPQIKSKSRRKSPSKRAKLNRKNRDAAKAVESSADFVGEDVEGRQSWFMFQRTYPFRSIPAEARRLAWQSRPARVKPTAGIQSATASVWTPIGPQPTRSYGPLFPNFGFNSGRINSIAISPVNSQIILVGASTGGIWRSSDGGLTFSPVSDSQVDLAVGAIAFSPSDPNVVYAGMGDMQSCCEYLGSGVLRSSDAGLTWTRVDGGSLPQPASVGDIEVDPNNPNKVYLALYRSLDASNANSFPYGGVYVSTNGGANWTRTFTGLPRDLAINPGNSQVIYAAMRGVGQFGDGGIGGLYRSVDGGLNWNLVYQALYPPAFVVGGLRDIRVAVSAANPQRVYVYSGNGGPTNGIRLAISNDGGATFPTDNVLTTVDRGQFGYNTYLEADPLNADAVYIGARDVFRSTNGGVTWTNLTKSFQQSQSGSFNYNPTLSNAHPDQHALAFSPGSPGVFFIGNDGGLYRTGDGGLTFQSLNQTLSLTQFVSIARHPVNPSITYGGTQDNGTQRRIGPTEWEDVASGDGGYLVINPANPSTFFVTYIGGTIWRFDDHGAPPRTTVATDSTFRTDSGGNERIAFYAPLTGNGVNSQLYFGTQRVWTSTNLGATWAPTGTDADLTNGAPDVLSAIGVAKSNPNVIYTGSSTGRAMVSTDGGQTWTNANAGLPNRFISSINVDYANPAVAYLTVSGFGSGHVFKTTNTGGAWTNISGIIGQGGLPNIPVNDLHIDLANPNLLYAGTDIGVFRSATGGNNWDTFNDGLPPAIVTGFTANNAGEIQLATYGRGAYQATITSVASISGRVVDGFGNGVSGATVSLSGSQTSSTTTDAAGNYSLNGLAIGGNFVLAPSKPGQYVGFTRTFNNLSTDSAGFDLQLTPFVIANVHTNDSTGSNLSSVAVSINNQVGAPLTNASGDLALNINVPAVGVTQTTLTPSKLGFAFNPTSFTFGSQSGNQNIVFNAIPPNPMDDPRTFVRQQYLDFLDREPDQAGLDYWTSQITQCGTDALCLHRRRIDISAAFFVELEFQRTGSFVYRLYKGGLGRRPTYAEFSADRAQVVEGANLEATKQALALAFVQRPAFVTKYNNLNTAETFVDALIANILLNSGINLAGARASLIAEYNAGTGDMNQRRTQAVRRAIEESAFTTGEYNPAFVLMQYFGYLRRDPDQGGYSFWLDVLNNRVPGNFRGMVCAFITSAEFQQRFGASVTRRNSDCGN